MTFYLSGAGAYCVFLLLNKFSDRECSKTDPKSWLVVAIASALWLIVIPISLMELRAKSHAKAKFDAVTKPRISQESLQHFEKTPVDEFESNSHTQLNPSNS